MPRTPLIAANWKMHPLPEGAMGWWSAYRTRKTVDVVVFPSFPHIPQCVRVGLLTGAQCGRPEERGAFTGDVSMAMLRAAGCQYVLCGHSERRQHHEESDAQVCAQVTAAIAVGLKPILCIGETWDQRELNEAKAVVSEQLSRIDLAQELIISYEPVWAIGTGKTPTPEQIADMHAFIRSLLKNDHTRILYGGSVTAENAPAILATQNVDGALVGGASLLPDQFKRIVAAANRV